uniref:NADH-plastoquinone oxidoreductase subunit K n=1 Tax=Tainia dunnii TaxID=1470429 RepID=A0A6C0ST95_9ASPA|nr:NADH-plastoquinone oxidoreductase subunit K [Tainia cordifolia]YP_009726709.1 NADH-plastoquinone oxidoreductase subunit K [Tainia dunnii]QHQ97180.1 NADH-plastoquinone oxidoreductase subunit K [Tainia cordifolia]QIA92415.1 NADH-plastoquinone oxidoreductase subunit K [Tainia dunnii]
MTNPILSRMDLGPILLLILSICRSPLLTNHFLVEQQT